MDKNKNVFQGLHERVKPVLEGARNIVGAARNRIREYMPGASEREVVQLSGDALVAKTDHDIEQATEQGGGVLAPEARERIVEDDVVPAVLTGMDEQEIGVPIDENAVTDLEAGGNGDLVTDAVREIAVEDLDAGMGAVGLVDSSTESLAENPHIEHESAERLRNRENECEELFKGELKVSFTELLTNLSPEEIQLIHADSNLRDHMACALEELGVEDTIGFGPHVETDYIGTPETMEQASGLVARAERVNDGFQASVHQVANDVGGKFKAGKVKTESRIAEKAEIEYGNDVDQVKDAVRNRITIGGDPTVDDLRVVEALRSAGHEFATNKRTGEEQIKRGFYGRDGQPLSVDRWKRYLDTKVTARILDPETSKTVLAEIAIATPEMAAATTVEHSLYELSRSIKTTEENSDVENSLRTKLTEMSLAFYKKVSDELVSRLTEAEGGGLL
jgi:hypothetical protein